MIMYNYSFRKCLSSGPFCSTVFAFGRRCCSLNIGIRIFNEIQSIFYIFNIYFRNTFISSLSVTTNYCSLIVLIGQFELLDSLLRV